MFAGSTLCGAGTSCPCSGATSCQLHSGNRGRQSSALQSMTLLLPPSWCAPFAGWRGFM